MKNIEQQILNLINQSQSILIMPSSPPDGDSLGSAMALYLALKKIHKNSTVVCADPIPEVYQFLPMIGEVSNNFLPTPEFIVTLDCQNAELDSIQSKVEQDKINIILTAKQGKFSAQNVSFSHGPNKYDLIITVDTAATQQLGRFYDDNVELFTQIPVVNIDHHPSNEQFGRINYVDVMSSSTTELILNLLEGLEEIHQMEIIDQEISTLLLAGIITDTGSFQHSNTSPRSFSNASKLIKRGARQQEIIQHVYKTKQLSTLRLWGRVLSNIKIEKDHRLLWSVITQKDLIDTGSNPDESGAIIDELMSNAPDTDLVLLLKEKSGDILSGSIRSLNDGVDASELAGQFGGGGHAKAAGFKIKNSNFAESGAEVINKIKAFQANRLNLGQLSTEKSSAKDQFEQTLSVKQQEIAAPKTVINAANKNHSSADQEKTSPTINKNSSATHKLDAGVKYKFEE